MKMKIKSRGCKINLIQFNNTLNYTIVNIFKSVTQHAYCFSNCKQQTLQLSFQKTESIILRTDCLFAF